MSKINITAQERRDLIEAIHANAVAKGFWAEDHSEQHYLMLAITELSEAVEADRKGRRARREEYERGLTCVGLELYPELFCHYIKDSVEDELADALIRIYDIVGAYEYRLIEEEISTLREKVLRAFERDCLDEFTSQILFCVTPFTFKHIGTAINTAIGTIEAVAEHNGIDLYWHVREKMQYNATRPALHGKKY